LLSVALVVAVLAGTVERASASSGSGSGAVIRWIEVELDAIAAHTTNPPRASRALALVSRAMYEAALAERRSPDDAVAGAASTVLLHLYPAGAARIAGLVGVPRSAESFALGQRIGERMVARALADGSSTPWTGTVPVGPGLWVPTPPGFVTPPLEPLAGTWQTWNLRSGSQFRPDPPPRFGSFLFLRELAEVYLVSRSLTEEQRRVAAFWADGAGTVTPPGHWNVIAIDLLRDEDWSTLGTARMFAALNTAQADAFIACWDAKYTYWSIRPVSAIRRLIDPGWLPFIVTPPFPSYVSGHSTTSGAASTVLASFLPRRSDQLQELAEEAAISRLYGGIHFRSDNDAGLKLGRQVGRVATEAYASVSEGRDEQHHQLISAQTRDG
jgi:hypothetical protein